MRQDQRLAHAAAAEQNAGQAKAAAEVISAASYREIGWEAQVTWAAMLPSPADNKLPACRPYQQGTSHS